MALPPRPYGPVSTNAGLLLPCLTGRGASANHLLWGNGFVRPVALHDGSQHCRGPAEAEDLHEYRNDTKLG